MYTAAHSMLRTGFRAFGSRSFGYPLHSKQISSKVLRCEAAHCPILVAPPMFPASLKDLCSLEIVVCGIVTCFRPAFQECLWQS